MEKPFLPEEVDKLANLKKKKIFYDDNLQNAQIIGGQNYQKGVVEVSNFLIFLNQETLNLHFSV